MDWDLYRTFAAVMETGSYLGASRRLGTSHPTVARDIAALERELGTRLFVRADEGLVPTSQGQKLSEYVHVMAGAALKASAAVGARGTDTRGNVKLSIGPTIASYWLMPHVAPFLELHPHIELELVTHPYPASISKREADIILRIERGSDETLVGRKVARLGVGFYASRSYAARHSLPQHRGDWRNHRVIGFGDKATNAELGRWSDHVAREAAVVMRCSSQSDMLAAARAGIGICAMSCIAGDAHNDLVRVAPQKLAGESDMWLLAHPDLIDQPVVRKVLTFVSERARTDRTKLRG
ncbi:MAG: LysR family transcriptional regulator [Pseudomonadota bacterium]